MTLLTSLIELPNGNIVITGGGYKTTEIENVTIESNNVNSKEYGLVLILKEDKIDLAYKMLEPAYEMIKSTGGYIISAPNYIEKYNYNGNLIWHVNKPSRKSYYKIASIGNGMYCEICDPALMFLEEQYEREYIPEQVNPIVNNYRKKYKIITDINEINGIKGGHISGESKDFYEIVKYGDTSIKSVTMVPDENY